MWSVLCGMCGWLGGRCGCACGRREVEEGEEGEGKIGRLDINEYYCEPISYRTGKYFSE